MQKPRDAQKLFRFLWPLQYVYTTRPAIFTHCGIAAISTRKGVEFPHPPFNSVESPAFEELIASILTTPPLALQKQCLLFYDDIDANDGQTGAAFFKLYPINVCEPTGSWFWSLHDAECNHLTTEKSGSPWYGLNRSYDHT